MLHLHGVGPVSFALEDQDLQILGVGGDEISCDWFLNIDVFLILLLRLGVLQGLTETKHTPAAVFMITAVVVVAEPVLVLGSFHQDENTLFVRSQFLRVLICSVNLFDHLAKFYLC